MIPEPFIEPLVNALFDRCPSGDEVDECRSTGNCCPIRSIRPIRCSTRIGFQGRSQLMRVRQKLEIETLAADF